MIKNVIFDYGNVLIDWKPEYLFMPYFGNEKEKFEFFLYHVCNREWFTRMDRGETMAQCVAERQAEFPEYAEPIAMFCDRWFEMCRGEIPGMLELIKDLKSRGIGVFGLTNWPESTFVEARSRFKTMGSIDNYVVSSSVKLVKPDPAIYKLLLSKYNLKPDECVFIDDRKDNVDAAIALGMRGIVYPGTAQELVSILYPMLGARNF